MCGRHRWFVSFMSNSTCLPTACLTFCTYSYVQKSTFCVTFAQENCLKSEISTNTDYIPSRKTQSDQGYDDIYELLKKEVQKDSRIVRLISEMFDRRM